MFFVLLIHNNYKLLYAAKDFNVLFYFFNFKTQIQNYVASEEFLVTVPKYFHREEKLLSFSSFYNEKFLREVSYYFPHSYIQENTGF